MGLPVLVVGQPPPPGGSSPFTSPVTLSAITSAPLFPCHHVVGYLLVGCLADDVHLLVVGLDVGMEGPVEAEGQEAVPCESAVGALPADEHDMAGWAQAWERERGRGWTSSTLAHRTMVAIDGGSRGNSFRKQMVAMKDAYVPGADDRSEAITVVRHEAELGYTKAARSMLATVVMAQMPPCPLAEYVVMATPFIGRPGFRPPWMRTQLPSRCGTVGT